jgi:hypothetical protein
MTVAVRKLRIEDVTKLHALVVENFDAIEEGLTVLDSRLLLGHATIDVLGVDSRNALVLGAVGVTANEDMLLKAVEAYSWCLEYPESLVRLYPSCEVSEDRPPRLLFVVERVPDAFHRKIKQLGFPEVDCVEVRHLEFDGVPAVYFETLLRLRRGVAPARSLDTPAAPPAPDTARDTRPVARAATPRLPKVPTPEPPASPRAAERAVPAPAVSTVAGQDAVAAPDRPVVEAPLPSLSTVEPEKVSLRDLPGLSLEPVVPSAPASAPSAVTSESAARLGGSSAIAAEDPRPAAGSTRSVARTPEASAPTGKAPIASAAPAPQPAASEPARPQVALPQEFAGLNFPNDGVLTRQWMDFLNQMSNSK